MTCTVSIWLAQFPHDSHSFHINCTVSTWLAQFPHDLHSFYMTCTISTWLTQFPYDTQFPHDSHSFHMTHTISTWLTQFPHDLQFAHDLDSFHKTLIHSYTSCTVSKAQLLWWNSISTISFWNLLDFLMNGWGECIHEILSTERTLWSGLNCLIRVCRVIHKNDGSDLLMLMSSTDDPFMLMNITNDLLTVMNHAN